MVDGRESSAERCEETYEPRNRRTQQSLVGVIRSRSPGEGVGVGEPFDLSSHSWEFSKKSDA